MTVSHEDMLAAVRATLYRAQHLAAVGQSLGTIGTVATWRAIEALVEASADGWKEATIAWSVCSSIHREYAKGKDPFFTTRQADFVKHENDCRKLLDPPPSAEPAS